MARESLEKLAAEAERTAAEQLKAMPKVSIIIPDDPQNPGDKVVPIGFNGVVYTVPRGVQVEVPQAIAEIYQDSYTRTRAVTQRIENSTQQEVKVM
ncbi:hypothetical protein [Paenibacillus rhizophilus]|uniref:Uncharacterized protein n=1 Tax=Paenibacillus rhizophilus TaxID=1850366 RepID=A0A3N9P1H4_9BACL|nr:hypothetical protein [Paenibacillus rhizophilus]RQW10041.1 hypothetical protein EH198_16535 [Paenibacillus rhizophilus]